MQFTIKQEAILSLFQMITIPELSFCSLEVLLSFQTSVSSTDAPLFSLLLFLLVPPLPLLPLSPSLTFVSSLSLIVFVSLHLLSLPWAT